MGLETTRGMEGYYIIRRAFHLDLSCPWALVAISNLYGDDYSLSYESDTDDLSSDGVFE
jgi:hypothetical protein